ncbi:nuclease-related domain-containing protein [Caulobacter segnis]|uniref:nuclease-related domain-containing protein n=1 Tax=Caulobacter segnis TaxID=88688 RepID=UPI00240F95D1|nr:nuclease-related domain-containing protein [Caulobacter segnis]MDG2520525.1 nuclease-related domain-containing protein [Caulobacter segnis]
MIPSAPKDSKSPAEAKVWRTLAKLPEDVFVFHSLDWMDAPRGPAREGEIDFLIIDPAFGVMIVEVKGGEIAHRNGQWLQGRKGEPPTIEIDPYRQASDNEHYLQRLVSRKIPGGSGIIFGHLVWFADADVSNVALPPSNPREITLDGNAVERAPEALREAYDYWRGMWPTKPAPGPRLAADIVAYLNPDVELPCVDRPASPQTDTVETPPTLSVVPTPAAAASPLHLRLMRQAVRTLSAIVRDIVLLPVRFVFGLARLFGALAWCLWAWCWAKCKVILELCMGVGVLIFVGAMVLFFAFDKPGALDWIIGGFVGSFAAFATHHLFERLETYLTPMLIKLGRQLNSALRVQY